LVLAAEISGIKNVCRDSGKVSNFILFQINVLFSNIVKVPVLKSILFVSVEIPGLVSRQLYFIGDKHFLTTF